MAYRAPEGSTHHNSVAALEAMGAHVSTRLDRLEGAAVEVAAWPREHDVDGEDGAKVVCAA